MLGTWQVVDSGTTRSPSPIPPPSAKSVSLDGISVPRLSPVISVDRHSIVVNVGLSDGWMVTL